MAKQKKKTKSQTQTKTSPPPTSRRSKRFTAEEKLEILQEVDEGATQVEVAENHGVHPNTLGKWMKLREQGKADAGDDGGKDALEPGSTKPHYSPSPVTTEEHDLIIESKRQNPEFGPAQLRNQLRRFYGVSLSHKVIRKILRQAGFELEKRVKDDEEASVERFEMTRPNELWTMDTKSFYVHDLKVWVVDIIDDYSRLIVGHRLYRHSPTANDAIATLDGAIATHGKPERVLTDRGGEFHSWQGQSRFNKYLEAEGIEHSLARPHHPQTCGKIEAVHRTLEKEFISYVRLDSFSHARRELAAYFDRYNHERTHMGIGGVTPADRYFGRIEVALAGVSQRLPSIDRDGDDRLPGERAIVMQIALVDGQIQFWFAGKRFDLPR